MSTNVKCLECNGRGSYHLDSDYRPAPKDCTACKGTGTVRATNYKLQESTADRHELARLRTFRFGVATTLSSQPAADLLSDQALLDNLGTKVKLNAELATKLTVEAARSNRLHNGIRQHLGFGVGATDESLLTHLLLTSHPHFELVQAQKFRAAIAKFVGKEGVEIEDSTLLGLLESIARGAEMAAEGAILDSQRIGRFREAIASACTTPTTLGLSDDRLLELLAEKLRTVESLVDQAANFQEKLGKALGTTHPFFADIDGMLSEVQGALTDSGAVAEATERLIVSLERLPLGAAGYDNPCRACSQSLSPPDSGLPRPEGARPRGEPRAHERGGSPFRGRPTESVDHPSHYNQHPSGVECVDVVEHMSFNLGNAVKYIWRAGLKSKDPIEDLKKARWYIDRELQRLGQPTSSPKE